MLDAAHREDAALGIRSSLTNPDTRIVDKGPATVTLLQAQPSGSNIATAQ